MRADYKSETMDPSGFVLLGEYLPHIVQEIRYYSTYNFIGDRIDGYEEPCALLTKEAARALKAVAGEMIVHGYRLKIFDAYRPACAVRHFVSEFQLFPYLKYFCLQQHLQIHPASRKKKQGEE